MRTRTAIILASSLGALASCTALSGAGDLRASDDVPAAAEDASAQPRTDGGVADAAVQSDATLPLPIQDAAPDATASTVVCNSMPCAGRCCLTQAGVSSCIPLTEACEPNAYVDMTCDETADCAGGLRCCVDTPGESLRFACRAGGMCPVGQLCAEMSECSPPVSCTPLSQGTLPLGYGKGGCF